jgi:hypothetical protein
MMEADDLAAAAVDQNEHQTYDTNNEHPATAPTIFDEAHECLAQSLLMFLYADLRLLSATGRINTKYETLCIASDRVPRTSAAGLAQLPGMNEFVEGDQIETVSPAQIMAILIVELRQEVIAQRRRAKEQIKRRGERGWFEPKSEDEDLEDDDVEGVMNKITDSRGKKEFETDMHAMVRAYNDMLRKDLKGIPEVKMTFSNPFARSADKAAENTPSRYTRQTIEAIRKFKDGLQGKHVEKTEGSAKEKPQIIRNAVSYDEYNRTNSSNSDPSHRRMFSSPGKTKLDDLFEEKSEEKSDEEGCNEVLRTPQAEENPHHNTNLAHSDMKGYHSKLYDFLESVKGLKSSQQQQQDQFEVMSDPGVASSRDEDSMHDVGSPLSRPSRRPTFTLTQQISTYFERAKEDHALYQKYLVPAEDYNTFSHAEDVGNAIFNGDLKMPSKNRLSTVDESISIDDEDGDRYMNETELLDFMTKCINSRDDTKLSFMKDFFKEDSPSATMVKSAAKIVWMNDWYTVKVRLLMITNKTMPLDQN